MDMPAEAFPLSTRQRCRVLVEALPTHTPPVNFFGERMTSEEKRGAGKIMVSSVSITGICVILVKKENWPLENSGLYIYEYCLVGENRDS